MFSTNLYLADGFTIQDNEKKLIFTVSTHCIQGSILKLLSILLWGARLHFSANMWHLSKWCSVPDTLRCGVKTRGWVQTHIPRPDTWQELQIYFIKHVLKACLNHTSSLVKTLPSYWLSSSKSWPWQKEPMVPNKWPGTLPHSPSDPSQLQSIFLEQKFKRVTRRIEP